MTEGVGSDRHPRLLTAQQERVLAVVNEYINQHGYPPTVREIGGAAGLRSPSSVTHHLKELERRGLLRRTGSPRALSTRAPTTAHGRTGSGGEVRVPLLGTVAAGYPIVAEQFVEDELTLPVSLVGRGTLFALHVRGDSMIEAAICDGDIVVVRQQPVAQSGDIVAALIDGEATIKVYRVRNGHVELVPRNPVFETLRGDDAVILGKVTCALRRL
ncbi:transcriptional repressor LexA [Nucisporomicrobium flavum]|uniref:transcriptional repressor LexA n=1 Tax=Nucisporomicrobium flavum TaxID=2785915 RepID=UPI0027DD235C|nr:transcriptional repressor LexA [Nucisporomicrobium flavum]